MPSENSCENSWVLTLVASPESPKLSETLFTKIAQRLNLYGLSTEGEVHWLSRNLAADIFFSLPPSLRDKNEIPESLMKFSTLQEKFPFLEKELRLIFEGAPIDLIIQPRACRRKQLFVADLDSTIIQQECIDELADGVGLKVEIAEITKKAMQGEIDFDSALKKRVALLKGMPVSKITEVLQKRVDFTLGAETLIRTLKHYGVYTALVSGSFTLFSQKIAEKIGFHISHANLLEICDGRLTGELRGSILSGPTKGEILIELRERLGLSPCATLAVGDGANDRWMLREAGLGIGFRPKPIAAQVADAQILHTDLTTLLYAQGYTSEMFRGD